MPVKTTVPIGGNAKITQSEKDLIIIAEDENVIVAPPSFSHLMAIYGTPKVENGIRQENEYEKLDGKLVAYATFIAVDPDEQDVVDEWAAQIDEDAPETIRTKISDFVRDPKKNKNQLDDLPSHSAKFS